MTEEEKKEFEEFLEWKAEKKRKEEEDKKKQEGAEKQEKNDSPNPNVEEEKSEELDKKDDSSSKKTESESSEEESSNFPFPIKIIGILLVILFLFALIKNSIDNNSTSTNESEIVYSTSENVSSNVSKVEKEKQNSINAEKAAEKKKQDSIKRAERIDLLKHTIKIKKAYLSSPNSAGGVDAHFIWKNVSKKTVKYLNWSGYPINAVGDPVSCEVRRVTESGGMVTGPIKPGATYGYGTYWECLWYNYSAKKLVLIEINIEYMDGSYINISKDELKYVR